MSWYTDVLDEAIGDVRITLVDKDGVSAPATLLTAAQQRLIEVRDRLNRLEILTRDLPTTLDGQYRLARTNDHRDEVWYIYAMDAKRVRLLQGSVMCVDPEITDQCEFKAPDGEKPVYLERINVCHCYSSREEAEKAMARIHTRFKPSDDHPDEYVLAEDEALFAETTTT